MGNNKQKRQNVTPLRPDREVNRLKKRQIKFREVHRVRRNRIIALILLAFAVLGFQLAVTKARTAKIEKQVSQSQTALAKAKSTKKKLTNERDDMKDSDYVAKVIRYKYKYTKSGERVYNIKEKGDN
ncbi:FtsB family cell division protein [Lactobacillus nasalidis]|nr:septum formation initiator family protein [Lactobacillus nasalidis]